MSTQAFHRWVKRGAGISLMALQITAGSALAAEGKPSSHRILVGNLCATAPNGIAMIVDDRAGFVIDPEYSERPKDDAQVAPGATAPDGSFVRTTFQHNGARITWTWGRSGDDAVMAVLTTDKPVDIGLKMKPSWTDFQSMWWQVSGGIDGWLVNGPEGYLSASLRTDPKPVSVDGNHSGEVTVRVHIEPDKPVCLAAGLGELPAFETIATNLAAAGERYEKRRIAASGNWGGFPQAITDSLNYSRLYSTFDHRTVHIIGRGWWIFKTSNNNPDLGPYFVWDTFFNASLAVLEDPAGARESVRAVLAYQFPSGMVPSFSHWAEGGKNFVSSDRSMPPVGALSVWKMHQRWPDKKFLAEVYPKLVRWHNWWPTERDGNHNGLLEWGSALGNMWGSVIETGWDDTPHFEGAEMSGPNMTADAVDLNAMWSMDAAQLALIAGALGKSADAKHFRAEHDAINKRMNDLLWNEDLGIYCTRLWKAPPGGSPFLTRITPMNLYPLACDAAGPVRMKRLLGWLYREDKFWGEWLLPTLPYDDPNWKQQHYWRGNVWAPPNWLVWQGIIRHADAAHRGEFARRSVKLFMRNWNESRICGENYRSDRGTPNGHPHYTWGALLSLIGVEALCGIDEQLRPQPYQDSGITETITMRNVPFGGKLYRIDAKGGKVTATPE